jgi:dienelactone hydrolase
MTAQKIGKAMHYGIALCVLVLANGVYANSHIDSDKGQTIEYSVGEDVYEGYYLASKDEDAALVYVVHDWDGLTEYEVKRAHMLAELGYSVFLADLFGKGVRPTEVADKKQHTGELYKDRKKMRAILNAGIEKAKDLGANTGNAVAMGYCFGGAAVLEFARSGKELKGFATFHGGLSTPEGQSYESVKSPILVLHGTADKNITMSDFSGLAEEFEASNVANEMITYGGADHAFTVFGGTRYHEEADQKSWARFTKFLAELNP